MSQPGLNGQTRAIMAAWLWVWSPKRKGDVYHVWEQSLQILCQQSQVTAWNNSKKEPHVLDHPAQSYIFQVIEHACVMTVISHMSKQNHCSIVALQSSCDRPLPCSGKLSLTPTPGAVVAGRPQFSQLHLRLELSDTFVEVLDEVAVDNFHAFAYYICPYHASHPFQPSPTHKWPQFPREMKADMLLIIHFVSVMRFFNGKVRHAFYSCLWALVNEFSQVVNENVLYSTSR